jgi:hypothetical protein
MGNVFSSREAASLIKEMIWNEEPQRVKVKVKVNLRLAV